MNSHAFLGYCHFTNFLPNSLSTLRAQALVHGNAFSNHTSEKEKASAWIQPIQITKKVNFDNETLEMRGAFLIKAVATLEPKCLVQNEDRPEDGHSLHFGHELNSQVSETSKDYTTRVDEGETLRRKRISKANKGNVPWNKGRKHSAETLQRIRERTKLAMQDPKVKMKLANLGHAQSNETRIKIGVGVRMRWQRRNEKIVLQETCCLEWQNLIAEACRRGSKGEIELQWNSYMILDKQMEREWSESIEEMNSTLKLKANRSAPKSPEQRKKISEAISAKWADPVYRERVQSAQLKYHGTPVGAKRRLRRKPSGDAQSLSRNPLKKNAASSGYENESKSQRWFRLKKNSEASYKDPLIDSKLQMIKNIRTQRSSIETNRTKAVQRAKLMISQAEKAVEVLEMVAAKNPRVQASLVESKKFLAKANDSMKSIKTGQTSSRRAKSYGYSSIGRGNGYEETVSANGVIQPNEEVNGTHVPVLNNNWSTKKTVSAEGNLIQPNEEVTGTHVTFLINKGSTESFGLRDLLTSGELLESYTQRDSKDEQMVPNEQEKADKCQRTVIKTEEKTKVPKAEKLVISDANTAINWKWVRGRRVEMSEDN